MNDADVECALHFKEAINSLEIDTLEEEEHSDTDSDNKSQDISQICLKIFELLEHEPVHLIS